MARLISIHEYDLRPDADLARFERMLGDAETRGLFRLPGLVAHHFLRGVKGARAGGYTALWIYESREAWERLWGTPDHPRAPHEYPEPWKVWEAEWLAPFLDVHPNAIRYTAHEEVAAGQR